MFFQYLKTEAYMDSIDISDIGNCYLSANNDEAEEWLLGINTSLGWSEVTIYGPILMGENKIMYNFYYSYNRFEFNDKKLYKVINDFINNPKKLITQVSIIEKDDFNNRLKSLHKMFM